MSDSLSFTTKTQAGQQGAAEQLQRLRDRLVVCIAKLEAVGLSSELSEEIRHELAAVIVALSAESLSFGQGSRLFVAQLNSACETISARADNRNREVLRYCLERLVDYLSEVIEFQQDTPSALILAFNELCLLNNALPVSESIFAVPDPFRVEIAALRTLSPRLNYLEFSQWMLGIYRGDNRLLNLQQLSSCFERFAASSENLRAKGFWLACSVFTQTESLPAGELRPALFRVYKQIENLLMPLLGDKQKTVLGMQQNIDNLLCNLLCHINDVEYRGKHYSVLEAVFNFSTMFPALDQPRNSASEAALLESPWISSGAGLLNDRLHHCELLLSENAISIESEADFLQEIGDLKRLLSLVGVHGAHDNLSDIERFFESAGGSANPVNFDSCITSLQLVQQQLLFQFDYLDDDIDSAETSAQVSTSASPVLRTEDDQHDTQLHPNDFGTRCNSCIDVIQQSLDTALGSSGNLMPDSSVVNALNSLIDILKEEGIQSLVDLLKPLSQILSEAQNSTLNQSETLLVQEAVIAATLGIDSLVSDKPMPELVADVALRIDEVHKTTRRRTAGGVHYSSSLNDFLSEAEELLPRLFELLQRLRNAPDGASRITGDINRLLHNLKRIADDVNLHSLASLVHYLESAMLDVQPTAPSVDLCDLAIESIEALGEDVERLRNREPTGDRSDLIERLKFAGALDRPEAELADRKLVINRHQEPDSEEPEAEEFESEEFEFEEPDSEEPKSEVVTTPSEVLVTEVPDTQPDTQPDMKVEQPQTESAAVQLEELKTEVVAAQPEEPVVENTAAVIVVDDQSDDGLKINWPQRFEQIEIACDAVALNHRQLAGQLVELQNSLKNTLQQRSAESDVVDEPTAAEKRNQQLLDEFADLAKHQSNTIKRLNNALGSASMVEPSLLRAPLIEAISSSARDHDRRVRFSFEHDSTAMHNQQINLIITAVIPLLESIVAHTITASADRVRADHSEIASIEVSVQQTASATEVKIIDDGTGVTVHGALPATDSPWSQVTRADSHENDAIANRRPTVWSALDNHPLEINPFIDAAKQHGGTVAIESDETGTSYTLLLPKLKSVHSVLVFEVHKQLLAIPASQVLDISLASGARALSVASLIGLAKQNAFDKSEGTHSIRLKTASGECDILVDKVIGRQSMEFHSPDRVVPDLPGYLGMAVADGGVVMLVDMEFWLSG